MAKVEKETKGLPAVALRFIYFGVALALFVVAAIVVYQKAQLPFELFGVETSATGITKLVEGFVESLKKGMPAEALEDGFKLIFIVGYSVYLVILLIIAAVYAIIIVIKLIIYAVHGKDKDKLFKGFRSLERLSTKVIILFFMFDCFLIVSGSVPHAAFIIEAISLILIFAGNCVYKILAEDVLGRKFDVQNLIYSLVEMLVVAGALLAVYFTVTKEVFFGEFTNDLIYSASHLSGSQPSKEFFIMMGASIVRLVGFFLALSMIKPVLFFYPFNDKKNTAEGAHPATDPLLGKSIACLVLYIVSGVGFVLAEKYSSYAEAFKGAPLMLVGILGVAISLRIAQKVNLPPLKKEEEPAAVEEKPAAVEEAK